MDDDVDFFTRKPAKPRSKAKPRPIARSTNGSGDGIAGPSSSTQPPSSAFVACTSASKSTHPVNGLKEDDDVMEIMDTDDEDDEDIVATSSDVGGMSDDSDASARRRAKRRKKKHTKILPAWASQGVFRRPSQEPTSSAPSSVDTATKPANGTSISRSSAEKDGNAEANGNGRGRQVSLTPPPDVSPEKLSMAQQLVSNVLSSKFPFSSSTTTASVPAVAPTAGPSTTRATRSSATPGPTASATLDEDDAANSGIHWDPDLARLMRGENAKHIREQAKREQEERDRKRKERELERIRNQPPSQPVGQTQRGGMGRTQSAPQTAFLRVQEDEDSDASVEFVPVHRPTTSPLKRSTRSSTSTAAAPIEIVDSDDDIPLATARPPSPPPVPESAETLTLTLRSKIGSQEVTVTPQTLLSKIVAHFHEKMLSGKGVKVGSIKVMFDGFGFKGGQRVEEMDVEDGDQVELSW